MRTKKTSLLITLFLFLPLLLLEAQEKDDHQAYWMHEDPVKPAMITTYEKTSKEFIAACKKHQLKDADFNTLRTNDFRYITISPISNMADFDKNTLAPLQEKMGKEAFGKIFKKFNECYDDHYDYVMWLHKELSYMPKGITITPKGKPYRELTYYYYSPANRSHMIEIAKGFKALYEKVGSKAHYRIYTNGFGERGTYFMVASAAESPEDMANLETSNNKLIGDGAKDLIEKLLKYTTSTKTITGYMRDDLSYVSN